MSHHCFKQCFLIGLLLFSTYAIQLRSIEHTAPDQVSEKLRQAVFQRPTDGFLGNAPEQVQLSSNLEDTACNCAEGLLQEGSLTDCPCHEGKDHPLGNFKLNFGGEEAEKQTVDLAETAEVLGIKSSNILFADTMKMHRANLERKAEEAKARDALAKQVYETLKEAEMKNGGQTQVTGEKSKLLDETLLEDKNTNYDKVGTTLSAEYFQRASSNLGAAAKEEIPFVPEGGIPAITVVEEQHEAAAQAQAQSSEGVEQESNENKEADERQALIQIKSSKRDEEDENEDEEDEEDEGENEERGEVDKGQALIQIKSLKKQDEAHEGEEGEEGEKGEGGEEEEEKDGDDEDEGDDEEENREEQS